MADDFDWRSNTSSKRFGILAILHWDFKHWTMEQHLNNTSKIAENNWIPEVTKPGIIRNRRQSSAAHER